MPRIRRSEAHREEQLAAAEQVAKLVGEPREKKRRITSPQKAAAEMDLMRRHEAWSDARAVHMVALYAWCHEQVYGVAPDELTAGKAGKAARIAAVGAAGRMLAGDFRGHVVSMVKFIRWVWQREKGREEWAANSNNKRHTRISWQVQFGGRALLTDYKVEIGRNASTRK